MKQQPIEKSLGRIDEIVARLEEGNCPLEESLALYEEGAALVALCRQRLAHAAGELARIERAHAEESAEEANG